MTKQIAKVQSETLPATEADNPWLDAAAEAGGGVGRLLKFVKGKWEVGDDVIPEGTEYVAHIDQLMRGWVCFKDRQVTDRVIGKIADGFKMPERETLPDNDPAKWEKDADGEPRDPWVQQWFLPMIGVESSDLLTFVTGSRGGIGAVANLCAVYGRTHRNGLLPIVALKVRSYKHKTFGRIETPDLPIVGWHGEPEPSPAAAPRTPTAPRTPAAVELDDPIPF